MVEITKMVRLSLDDIQEDIETLSRLAANCDKRAVAKLRQVSYWMGRAEESGESSPRTALMKKSITYAEEDILRCWN